MRQNDAFVMKKVKIRLTKIFIAIFDLAEMLPTAATLGNTHILMRLSPLEFKKIYWQRTCNSIYSYF